VSVMDLVMPAMSFWVRCQAFRLRGAQVSRWKMFIMQRWNTEGDSNGRISAMRIASALRCMTVPCVLAAMSASASRLWLACAACVLKAVLRALELCPQCLAMCCSFHGIHQLGLGLGSVRGCPQWRDVTHGVDVFWRVNSAYALFRRHPMRWPLWWV